MNQGTYPLMVYDEECNSVIDRVKHSLARSGFAVAESFDLQVARARHSDCTCPHHGTSECTCQLAILLVYSSDGKAVTLMVHGYDRRTELSIVETPDQRVDPTLKKTIASGLKPHYWVYSDHESTASVP